MCTRFGLFLLLIAPVVFSADISQSNGIQNGPWQKFNNAASFVRSLVVASPVSAPAPVSTPSAPPTLEPVSSPPPPKSLPPTPAAPSPPPPSPPPPTPPAPIAASPPPIAASPSPVISPPAPVASPPIISPPPAVVVFPPPPIAPILPPPAATFPPPPEVLLPPPPVVARSPPVVKSFPPPPAKAASPPPPVLVASPPPVLVASPPPAAVASPPPKRVLSPPPKKAFPPPRAGTFPPPVAKSPPPPAVVSLPPPPTVNVFPPPPPLGRLPPPPVAKVPSPPPVKSVASPPPGKKAPPPPGTKLLPPPAVTKTPVQPPVVALPPPAKGLLPPPPPAKRPPPSKLSTPTPAATLPPPAVLRPPGVVAKPPPVTLLPPGTLASPPPPLATPAAAPPPPSVTPTKASPPSVTPAAPRPPPGTVSAPPPPGTVSAPPPPGTVSAPPPPGTVSASPPPGAVPAPPPSVATSPPPAATPPTSPPPPTGSSPSAPSPPPPVFPPLPPIVFPPPPPTSRNCTVKCPASTILRPPLSSTDLSCVCVKSMLVILSLQTDPTNFLSNVQVFAQELANGTGLQSNQVVVSDVSYETAATAPPATASAVVTGAARSLLALSSKQAVSSTLQVAVSSDLVPLTGSQLTKDQVKRVRSRLVNHSLFLNPLVFGNWSVILILDPGQARPPPPPPFTLVVSAPGVTFSLPPPASRAGAPGGSSGGLPGWAIALIILLPTVGVALLCIVFALLYVGRRDKEESRANSRAQSSGAVQSGQDGRSSEAHTRKSGSSAPVTEVPSSPFDSVPITGIESRAVTYSLTDIKKATESFSEGNLLGRGGSSLVYRGQLDNGQLVAVKKFVRGETRAAKEFIDEATILSCLNHRNLVQFLGICNEEGVRCLVYELVPNGSLYWHLHGPEVTREEFEDFRPPILLWSARTKIALGAARGLAYLHEDSNPRFIHRDFKSANILLENDFTPKVSDLGLAKKAHTPGSNSSEMVSGSLQMMGTFGYVAPEYALTGHLLVKSDVYSFGVVLLELISGRPPVLRTGEETSENLVEWARPFLSSKEGLEKLVDPALDGNYPPVSLLKLAAIASSCVQTDHTHRPFMGEVVQALKLIHTDTENSDSGGSSTVFRSQVYSADMSAAMGVTPGREQSSFTAEELDEMPALLREGLERFSGSGSSPTIGVSPSQSLYPPIPSHMSGQLPHNKAASQRASQLRGTVSGPMVLGPVDEDQVSPSYAGGVHPPRNDSDSSDFEIGGGEGQRRGFLGWAKGARH